MNFQLMGILYRDYNPLSKFTAFYGFLQFNKTIMQSVKINVCFIFNLQISFLQFFS